MRQQTKELCLPNPANAVYCDYPNIYLRNKTEFNILIKSGQTLNFNCQNVNGTTVIAEIARSNDIYTFNELLESQHNFDYKYVPPVLGAITPLAQSVKSGSFDIAHQISLIEIDNEGVYAPLSQNYECGHNCETSSKVSFEVCHNPLVYASSYQGSKGLQAFTALFPPKYFCVLCGYPTEQEILEASQCTYTDQLCPTSGDQPMMANAIPTAAALVLGVLAAEISLF